MSDKMRDTRHNKRNAHVSFYLESRLLYLVSCISYLTEVTHGH